MKKYNVNIDRQKPSPEEILSRRDFDGLMKQYAAVPGKVVHKPFWKSGWFIGSMATAVVVATAVVIYSGKQNQEQKTNPAPGVVQVVAKKDSVSIQNNSSNQSNAFVPVKRKITPPISGLNIRKYSYKFNSAKGTTFTHNSGTKVTFPANAFVDASGNPVSGNVEIQYREFRDQVDFFLSGIPMQYDSAQQTFQFESAGMMEISGFIDGKVVYLKKDKEVKVEFASKESGTQYNLYKFDTLAGNWDYISKDKVVPVKVDTTNKVNNNTFRPHPHIDYHFDNPPVEPVKPVKADKKKNRFTVAINPKEFPEMSQYKDMIFEVDESNQKFNKSWYAVTWESIKLSYGETANKYKIALAKGKEVVMLDVVPVLDDKAYAEAMAKYDIAFAAYSKKLAEYNAWVNGGSQPTITGGGPLTPAQQASVEKEISVMRTFNVSGFGVYNMDCPSSYPKGAMITLNLKDDNGNAAVGFDNVFLADRHKKALYNYYFNNTIAAFHFNPASSNLVWAVKNGALFYADNDQFTKLPASGNGALVMKPVEKEFKSPEEMKRFFKISQGV